MHVELALVGRGDIIWKACPGAPHQCIPLCNHIVCKSSCVSFSLGNIRHLILPLTCLLPEHRPGYPSCCWPGATALLWAAGDPSRDHKTAWCSSGLLSLPKISTWDWILAPPQSLHVTYTSQLTSDLSSSAKRDDNSISLPGPCEDDLRWCRYSRYVRDIINIQQMSIIIIISIAFFVFPMENPACRLGIFYYTDAQTTSSRAAPRPPYKSCFVTKLPSHTARVESAEALESGSFVPSYLPLTIFPCIN